MQEIQFLNGYLYVYVSNEMPNINVYFDNLQVTHIRGPLLEESHYYPYGTAMAQISSRALNAYAPNRYKANGGAEFGSSEWANGSGLEQYETAFRSYDAQTGRFLQVDPLAESSINLSSYAFGADNPAMYVDPNGDKQVNGLWGSSNTYFGWQPSYYSHMDGNGNKWHYGDGLIGTASEGMQWQYGNGWDGFGDFSSDGGGGGHLTKGFNEGYSGYWYYSVGGGEEGKEKGVMNEAVIHPKFIRIPYNNQYGEDGPGPKNGITKENIEAMQKALVSGEAISLNFQLAANQTRGLVTITTKNGIIRLSATTVQYANLAKAFSALGQTATAFEMLNSINEYNNGEIGRGRALYRLTTGAASLLSDALTGALIGSEAGPIGTVVGIAVALAAPAGELLYDNVIVPAANETSDWLHDNVITPINNMADQLSRGWHY